MSERDMNCGAEARGIPEADNRCVCCGEIIPEGRMICWGCEKGNSKKG